MKISILCPTRERPEGALRMAQSAHDCAYGSLNAEILFYVDDDDPRLHDYERFLPKANLIIGPFVPTCRAWNLLWMNCKDSDLFMLGSDDIIFTDGWDKSFAAHMSILGDTPQVFHLTDSRHPTNTPHPIVTNSWARIAGTFMPEQFHHYYVDSFTCWAAKLTGLFTQLGTTLIHDKTESSAARFPWAKEWLARDREEWARSLPNLEILVSKLLRATGR